MAQLALAVGQRAAQTALQGALGYVLSGAVAARDIEGPRLETLRLQTSTAGAPLPLVYGRMRLGGQVIWATRFTERRTRRAAGGKGGPRVTEFDYSASFAVALCEGPIDGVGRVWADGRPLVLDDVTMRVYRGTEDQAPDPLIEAVEGAGDVPAFRGVAYLVFEDLPLDAFGNRLPQLNVEVFRAAEALSGADEKGRLEQLARGVTLIPGSGEFAYATTPVRRDGGPGVETFENVNNARGRTDLQAALDDLEAHLPQCRSVMLVTSWFGDDLRAGHCQIRPKVETHDKKTRGLSWSVSGLARKDAALVSQDGDGRPNFGGAPSDNAIVEAIAELKTRGFQVGIYPFLLMDIPATNVLPDPYGGSVQPPFPWRGRITVHPAAGQPSSADQTADAASQIAAFFGTAAPGDFVAQSGGVAFTGLEEWSFRRLILHYARLAEAAGGVDTFVIGSEMRGLTWVRDASGAYPAVAALRALAADVKGMLGAETVVTYAADWSEYFGHQPQDGSGDVFFHLDPLWADPAIDVVGIDWYAPLSDWRDGAEHLDAAAASSGYDRAYLEANVEGGEGYDWYYASAADRASQTRTPITDGAGKPWVFRYKDMRNWWLNAHYDRPGGVENGAPTAWIPQSKPIWFVEVGCPAVDKGANQPNVFFDPKSSESFLPYFSDGGRDDLMQRRALEAVLRYWDPTAGLNPVSSQYGGPMLAWDSIHLWTWDARPFPDFPARTDVWSDGGNWRLGHWLNGRLGLAPLGDVVADLCARAGLAPGDVDVAALDGLVAGYVIASPGTARAALEPLAQVFQFTAAEQSMGVSFARRGAPPVVEITPDALALDADARRFERRRADPRDEPREARVRFYDESRDYQPAAASARGLDAERRRALTVNAPITLDHDAAARIARGVLADAAAGVERVNLRLPPSRFAVETGDRVTAPALGPGGWRVTALEEGPSRRVTLEREGDAAPPAVAGPAPGSAAQAPPPPARPFGVVLDMPLLPGEADRAGPRVAAASTPWPGLVTAFARSSAGGVETERAALVQPAVIGALDQTLAPGPLGRWDEGNALWVTIAADLASAAVADVYAGANALAVADDTGAWELLQFRDAALVGPNQYRLSGLLRALAGTDPAMAGVKPAGAAVVLLDGASLPAETAAHEREAVLTWRFAPQGRTTPTDLVHEVAATYRALHLRPLSPVHVRAKREVFGVRFRWVRRTRIGGDDWVSPETPLGETREAYRVEILDADDTPLWTQETASPEILLATDEETALFPDAPKASFAIRIAQVSDAFGPGAPQTATVFVAG